MKVKQLIDILSRLPPEHYVVVEINENVETKLFVFEEQQFSKTITIGDQSSCYMDDAGTKVHDNVIIHGKG